MTFEKKYKRMKKIIISLISFLLVFELSAQDHMVVALGDTPQRNQLNPGYMPSSSYVSLPLFGSLGGNIGALNYGSFMINNSTGNYIDGKKLIDRVSGDRPVLGTFSNDIINLGIRIDDKNLVTFGVKVKASVGSNIPTEMLRFMYANPIESTRGFNPKLKTGSTAWAEMAFGYTRIINDNWSVGMKVKLLDGLYSLHSKKTEFQIDKSISDYTVKGDVDLYVGNYNLNDESDDFKFSANMGAAFDFGAMYDSNEGWRVGFSVTDLGFINWRESNSSRVHSSLNGGSGTYVFEGVGNVIDVGNFGDAYSQVWDDLLYTVGVDTVNQKFRTVTPTVINASGEYAFNNEKAHVVSLNALGRFAYRGRFDYNITAGYRYTIPSSRFSAIGTLSTNTVDPMTLGLGVIGRSRGFQFFLTTDYSLTGWGGIRHARSFSVKYGFNFFFGKFKKDVM